MMFSILKSTRKKLYNQRTTNAYLVLL